MNEDTIKLKNLLKSLKNIRIFVCDLVCYKRIRVKNLKKNEKRKKI